jgi:hypothetical protein
MITAWFKTRFVCQPVKNVATRSNGRRLRRRSQQHFITSRQSMLHQEAAHLNFNFFQRNDTAIPIAVKSVKSKYNATTIHCRVPFRFFLQNFLDVTWQAVGYPHYFESHLNLRVEARAIIDNFDQLYQVQ